MNPFDLRGPEFLLFYTVLGGGLLAALEFWRRFTENSEIPKINLSDPYEIAYLRGGKNEALRVATMTLIDRGFITMSETTLLTAPKVANLVKNPIERAVLAYFYTPQEAWSVFRETSSDAEMKRYEEELCQAGLLPTKGQWMIKMILKITAAVILLGVAAHKIDLAIQRGRSNYLFLFMLALLLVFIVFWRNPRRTPAGDKFLDDLKQLFQGLKDRLSTIERSSPTNELALALSVFGVGILDASDSFVYLKKLFPKASQAGSCGSSCGSSSCGSGCGGGGCGGGGCGGGCGGCGG